MSESSDPSRRQFLRTLVRWTIAPAMVAAVGDITFRQGETCVNNTICRTCGVASTCGLPQALSYRDATKRGESHAG